MWERNSKYRKYITCYLVLLLFLLVIIPFFINSSNAQDDIEIAEEYAPILYFESDEKCFPVSVNYCIDNSELYQYTSDGPILINSTPTIEELGLYSSFQSQYQYVEDYYLDNIHGTVNDYGVMEDYQNKMGTLGYTLYSRVHVVDQYTIIQYWFFYAFNKGDLNQHEGDWELVQVVLDNDEPYEVMYSQHHSGQKASWNQVEREGNHIKVYVARGSHANYLRYYSGMFGGASDHVGCNGKILNNDDYKLEILNNQSWLLFAGRWGEYNGFEDDVRGRSGPFGPMYRENGLMWGSPMVWGDSLPAANDFIFFVEWFLYHFILIFVLSSIISLCFIFYRVYRRHQKYGLGPRILSFFYIDGLNLKSIGNILCIIGVIMALYGLILPWYGVSINVKSQEMTTQGMVNLIMIDGINGVQINLLESDSGLVQFGSFQMPFSLLIGIGIVFFILGTIGVSKSKKIGKTYISRGIKIVLPIIVILIIFMMIKMMPIGISGDDNSGMVFVNVLFDSISGAPVGGEKSLPITVSGSEGLIEMKWGLGMGGQLLIFGGLILVLAGIVEIIFNSIFFEERKISEDSKFINKEKEKSEKKENKDESESKTNMENSEK